MELARLEVLSDAEIRQIHEASADFLCACGLKVFSRRLRSRSSDQASAPCMPTGNRRRRLRSSLRGIKERGPPLPVRDTGPGPCHGPAISAQISPGRICD